MDFSQPLNQLLLVGAGLLLLIIAVRLRSRAGSPGTQIRAPGKLFLVLLRMAIGWHFLVEGLEKYCNPAWTSEPYLREASGPLAPRFRDMAGDSVIDQLTLGEDKTFPAALEKSWHRYLAAFTAHYGLSDEQQKEAARIFDQEKSKTVTWLQKPQQVAKPSPIPEPKLTEEIDVQKRLERYRELKAAAEKLEAELPTRFREKKEYADEKGRGRARTRMEELQEEKAWQETLWKEWLEAKAAANKYRADLKRELDQQTKSLKDALHAKDEKDAKDAKKDAKDAKDARHGLLTAEQMAQPAMDYPPQWPIDWTDRVQVADTIVKYGLMGIGACLIVGAFTPLAAVLGAVFLVMFYLPMPPMPYLPDSPRSEGHYLYINKNVIEALALLALAYLPTGRWAGLDGILQFFNPFNWRRREPSGNVALSRRQESAARR